MFFKQYKSPAPTVVWYGAFVAYQKELGARVRAGKAANLAVRQIDAFEEVWGGPCYFQVFEFVHSGADLQQVLDTERKQHRQAKLAPAREPSVWARHVTWAKVLTAAVAALHGSHVVHADLKPANAYLVEDHTIGSGYQLKLIDMDFSLLSDRRAPWHGFQGYIGSDNYRSPEHLARGSVPAMASDVFTCGLMLYELLVGEQPYWRDDQAEYAALVRAYAAKPPALLGSMPLPALNAEVSAALQLPVTRPRSKTHGRSACGCPERTWREAGPAEEARDRAVRRHRGAATRIGWHRAGGPGRPCSPDRCANRARQGARTAVRSRR